jgi:outer membrane murein-binding lipoprotein Lpp
MRKLALAVAVLSLVVMLPGCSSMGKLFGTPGETGPDPQLVAQYEQAKTNLEELKANATADINQAVAEGDAKLEAKARETLKTVERIEKAAEDIEKVVKRDEAGNLDPAATVTGAAALLPPPWNVLAMLGIPLVVGGIQEYRKRQSDATARSIVNSVDVLMSKSEAVKSALKGVDAEVKAAAHEQLTPAAKKLIDTESVT